MRERIEVRAARAKRTRILGKPQLVGLRSKTSLNRYCPTRSRLQIAHWLDVDEHVSDPRIAILNRTLDIVRDAMSFADRNVAIHPNVKINIKTEAHLADETFFDLDHTRHRSGGVLNGIDNGAAWGRVH